MKKGKERKNRSFESRSNPSFPNGKKSGNSPKRCRTDSIQNNDNNENTMINKTTNSEVSDIDNVASQVTIESHPSPSSPYKRNNDRLDFINAQRDNRYASVLHSWFT